MGWYYGYKPYVPVAQRRANAKRELAKLLKNGQKPSPVKIEGRNIASTFWGKAWCTNLESYSDFANRLPRGRTYARNGSIVHMTIDKGRIDALVSGSELYTVKIEITAQSQSNWQALKEQCAGKIGTLVELLRGKLSQAVMELVTDRNQGLFPKPKEIKMRCSCPDGAYMCKHLAAVMYGVGNRLDSSPELLFVLRGLDHMELIEQAIPKAPAGAKKNTRTIAADDLGAIFDIEMGDAPAARAPAPIGKKPASKSIAAKPTTTKAAATKAAPVAKATAKVGKTAPSTQMTAKAAATKASVAKTKVTKAAPVATATAKVGPKGTSKKAPTKAKAKAVKQRS